MPARHAPGWSVRFFLICLRWPDGLRASIATTNFKTKFAVQTAQTKATSGEFRVAACALVGI